MEQELAKALRALEECGTEEHDGIDAQPHDEDTPSCMLCQARLVLKKYEEYQKTRMKAENTTTDHNRTIRLTNIPPYDGKGYTETLPELLINVNYVHIKNDGNIVGKAIILDNVVIPAILKAINGE